MHLMNALEYLRYIARIEGEDSLVLAGEVAYILAEIADDRAILLNATRRLLDRHPNLGIMWMMSARLLGSLFPQDEAWEIVSELSSLDSQEVPDFATGATLFVNKFGKIGEPGEKDGWFQPFFSDELIEEELSFGSSVNLVLESDLVADKFAVVSSRIGPFLDSSYFDDLRVNKVVLASDLGVVPSEIRDSLESRLGSDRSSAESDLIIELNDTYRVSYQGNLIAPNALRTFTKWRIPQEILKSAGPLLG